MSDAPGKDFPLEGWTSSVVELIRKTSTTLPEDVARAIAGAAKSPSETPRARSVLGTISRNAAFAAAESVPMCQDTGTLTFWLRVPPGVCRAGVAAAIRKGVEEATSRGYLRQNTLLPIDGKPAPSNVADGCPLIHFEDTAGDRARVSLLLKGGGCENMSAQYSLPDATLGAGRDLAGVRACVLHAVWRAQGMGCAPGVLGVCVGGDRATGYELAKRQLLRPLDDEAEDPVAAGLEREILSEANTLGVGPMGLGGETTLLGVKIAGAPRLPASYFVTVAYSCWACRRHSAVIDPATGLVAGEGDAG